MYCRSALLLASLWGIAGAQTPPDSPNLTGPLTIVLRGNSAISAEALNAMQREVESLVEPSSIRVAWTSSTTGAEVYDRVAVVRLRGDCRVDAPLLMTPRTDKEGFEPLGQTQVVDRDVLPFAAVRCDAVRKLIGRDLALQPSYEREDLFGRALGRVLAHELYHILLRTTSHGRQGLARPAQSSADLLADRDNFAPADERKLSQSSSSDSTESFASNGR
jgi:hypothetical protein